MNENGVFIIKIKCTDTLSFQEAGEMNKNEQKKNQVTTKNAS